MLRDAVNDWELDVIAVELVVAGKLYESAVLFCNV